MANITLPHVYTPGEILPAAYVNSDFQTIYNDYNGNIDDANIAAAADIELSKLALNPGTEAFNQQAVAGAYTWASGETTDSDPRLTMTADGHLLGGPGGTTTPDVGLQRTAPGTWQLTSPSGTPTNPILDMNNGQIINVGPISTATAPPVQGGRLYVATGDPYGDGAASSLIYYGSATCNVITLFNGTIQVPQVFSEASLSVGTLSGVYDIYVSSATSTTVALNAVAWGGLNTPPARSLDSYGRLCQSGTPTNLLVGVIAVTSANKVVDTIAERFVSNVYNPIAKALFCQDTTGNWAYSTATIRPANANTTDGVGRVSFVSWLPIVPIETTCFCGIASSAAGVTSIGLAVDSTTAYLASAFCEQPSATGLDTTLSCSYAGSLATGFHYLQRLEYSNAVGSNYYYSSGGAGGVLSGGNGLTAKVFN